MCFNCGTFKCKRKKYNNKKYSCPQKPKSTITHQFRQRSQHSKSQEKPDRSQSCEKSQPEMNEEAKPAFCDDIAGMNQTGPKPGNSNQSSSLNGDNREDRSREPSVSEIESDQSESLERLSPEMIVSEEDITSDEEEGEIKNYEKKKHLKGKKKELQREKSEQISLEISPNRSAIDLNGKEEGEIPESGCSDSEGENHESGGTDSE